MQPFETIIIASILALMAILSRAPRTPYLSSHKLLVILLSVALSIRYILWRGLYTLSAADYIALSITLTLFLAELYGFLTNLLFHYQSSRAKDNIPPRLNDDELPSVDILITIFNEPKEILLRTIIGSRTQDYPEEKFRVYVLDDSSREEIKELALRYGCEYISRPTRENAKAGNLNNGLLHSSGEIVAIFDCDHIPVRSFLKETVGFFKDPKVAIVQVPHHFYNPDIFQRNLKLEKEIAHEQDLFFHVIQPGRDWYNSAFYAGSCGLFRRSALEEIGGVLTETLTEDIHTSMTLHSKGYRSVYLNRDLSAGLAPESSRGYIKQRMRWTTGGIQIFLLDNPFFKRGLTMHQRLNYFAAVFYFFHSIPRIVYLSAPLSYLLFSYPPIKSDILTLLFYFLPHYMGSTIAFAMVSGKYRNPFWSDVYETLMSFALTLTVFKTVLRPRRHPFVVTPKGEKNKDLRLDLSIVSPHIALFFLITFGVFLGIHYLITGEGDTGAIVISLAWALYNSIILLSAIIAAQERPQRRGLIRLEKNVKCELLLPKTKVPCTTRDLSETGLSLVLDEPLELPNPFVKLNIFNEYGGVLNLKGIVVRNDRAPDGKIIAGVHFLDDRTLYYNYSLIRWMFGYEESWGGEHAGVSESIWGSFRLFFTAILRTFMQEKALRRLSPRFSLVHACELVTEDGVFRAEIRDISLSGMSLETEGPDHVIKEATVRVSLKDGEKISLDGEVIWLKKTKKGTLLGIRFKEPGKGREVLKMIN